MLVVAGSSYAGMDAVTARKLVVPTIIRHATEHPFGIVLLDDLTAMDPEVVRCLYPLLGRGEHFPEAPAVSLHRLTVIVTTDFGDQGQTQGLTPTEIRGLVDKHFGATFGVAAVANVLTFPFLPFTNETVKRIVAQRIASLPCRYSQVSFASYQTNSLVLESFLADRSAVTSLRNENGHALMKMVDEKIDRLVRSRIHRLGSDVRFSVMFDLNAASGAIDMRTDKDEFGAADL
jgi:ATP-dependent Clp protease ATP-binding subunit ClpA